MKKYNYIGISFIVLIFGILVIPEIIDRVNQKDVVTSNRSDSRGENIAASKEELRYILIDEEKKKIPEFKFVNQHGDTISNEDYRGKVYVVEFFFSTCPTICPIMKENLVKVQNELKGNENFGIASFSIDPSNDSPEVLKEYAEKNGITHENWNLMTGDREDIYSLANSGFNVYVGENTEAEGGFVHSGYFALIDQDGYIRSRQDRFGNPLVYYRGSVKQGTLVQPGEEEPQTNILIQDIKNLLNDES